MYHCLKSDGVEFNQELSSAGAIRDADPMTKAAHVQRLQGMAEEIKAMMGALGAAKRGSDNGDNFEGGQREEDDEEEEQLYVNIGSIMNKGRHRKNTPGRCFNQI